jgi:septum formation protein
MRESPLGAFETLVPLILASESPRRRELLSSLGLVFEVVPSNGNEPPAGPSETPAAYALRLAEQKAREVAARFPGRAVLGADTVVAVQGELLGKPRDPADAKRMLALLAGRSHEVVTGCCLILPDGSAQHLAESTAVTMRPASQAELLAYAATGEPADKAGAYAIQGLGGFLVERIQGSASNVVGLPLSRVSRLLLERGIIAARRPAAPNAEGDAT